MAFSAYTRYLDLVSARGVDQDAGPCTFYEWAHGRHCLGGVRVDDGEAGVRRCAGLLRGGVAQDVEAGGDSDGCDSPSPCEEADVFVEGVAVSSHVPGHTVRGPNWARNQQARERKKARRSRGGQPVEGGAVRGGDRTGPLGSVEAEARASLAAKWKAENELAAAKARRALEVEMSRDVEQLKRALRTRTQRTLERDMVAIEKSHATLKATGNVPGVPPAGFAETVVDSVPGLTQDCTISPDSSASQAEVRAMAKANADLEAKLKKIIDYTGVNPDHIDFYEKKVWTETRENNILLNEMYPDGYIKDEEYAPNGKFNLIPI